MTFGQSKELSNLLVEIPKLKYLFENPWYKNQFICKFNGIFGPLKRKQIHENSSSNFKEKPKFDI